MRLSVSESAAQDELPVNGKITGAADNSRRARSWMRRAGVIGFLFFLLKGLAWLALGAWALVAADCGEAGALSSRAHEGESSHGQSQ